NRRDDWAEIIELANRVLGYFQDRVAVEVVHDRSVFDALQVPNKRFTPRCSHQAYLQLLASCDIALMPLRDTPFNRCKSDLKFIECAAHGVVSLAPMTVYAATLADGRTGVLYRSSVEFMVGLQRLIQEVDLRTRIAGAGRKYVADQRMQADHYEARHAWYLELIAKADDLRTSHRRRMPDLYG
ncbi:MAG: glycosyltransferase, partial [Proteobacteria bacterium]|nr:glycosyltransferase [Pseudomonadota bacterium]